MDVLNDVLSFIRRLARRIEAKAMVNQTQAVQSAGFPSTASNPSLEMDEFADLLNEIGSTPPAPTDDTLSLSAITIAELQANLAMLQPLGEQLADTEQARLRSEAHASDLEHEAAIHAAQSAGAETLRTETGLLWQMLTEAQSIVASQQAKLTSLEVERDQLEKAMRRQRAANERIKRSLETARRRRDERHRIASERWEELLALKSELKQLRAG